MDSDSSDKKRHLILKWSGVKKLLVTSYIFDVYIAVVDVYIAVVYIALLS